MIQALWRSADRAFAAGTHEGTTTDASGALVLGAPAQTGVYLDPFEPDASRAPHVWEGGAWESPVVSIDDALVGGATEAIPSWNARTPAGCFVEIAVRGRVAGGEWAPWRTMARWAEGAAAEDIHRTSVDDDATDAWARVATDVYASRPGVAFDALQVRVALRRPAGAPGTGGVADTVGGGPRVTLVAVDAAGEVDAVGERAPEASLPASLPPVAIDVPPLAQHVHDGRLPEIGGGGDAWCAPTSVAMVRAHFGHRPDAAALDAFGDPDPEVPHAATGAFDHAYGGTGNWAFGAAFAAVPGDERSAPLEAYIQRLDDLTHARAFLDAGIPLVASIAFARGELPGADYATGGHLLVIRGFDERGDVLVADPAAPSNERVLKTYPRAPFERLWQRASRGVVYVIAPEAGVRGPEASRSHAPVANAPAPEASLERSRS